MINWRRDLTLVKRNDVRSSNFSDNQIEHSHLEVPKVTRYISGPVHANRERYSEKNDCGVILCFSRFSLVLYFSSLITTIFLMNEAYSEVLDINSVKSQKLFFRLHRVSPQVRSLVELRQYSIKPKRPRPTNSESEVNSQCDSD